MIPLQLGDVIRQAHQARHFTLRHLPDQVMKEDGTPISPQYLFDIEVCHRVPTPHVLYEPARILELDYDALMTLAGGADTVVREYLARHREHTGAVIKLFRAADQRGFEDWAYLRHIIERGAKRGR